MSQNMNETFEANALNNNDQTAKTIDNSLSTTQLLALQNGHATEVNGFTHYHFSGVSFNYRKAVLRSDKPSPKKYVLRKKNKNIASIRCDIGFDWDNIDIQSCCFPKLPSLIDAVQKRRKIKPIPYWNPIFNHLGLNTDDINFDQYDMTPSYEVTSQQRQPTHNTGWATYLARIRNKTKHSENGNIFNKFNNYHTNRTWYFDHEETFYLTDFINLSGTHHTINYIQRESPHFYDIFYIGRNNNTHLISIPYWAMSTPHNIHGKYSLLQIQALLAEHMHDFVRICDFNIVPIVLFLKKLYLPMKHSDIQLIKEDTRRNSKTIRSQDNTRLSRLSNSHPDIAKEKIITHNNRITLKRQNAAHKAVMRQLDAPSKHSATDPYSLNFFKNDNTKLFLEIEALINKLPKELSTVLSWAEVLGSIYILVDNPCYVAKAVAAKALYRHFGVQGMCIAAFSQACVKVFKYFFVDRDPTLPVKQINSEMQSALATLITVVLSLLYQKKATDGQVSSCLKLLSQVPQTSRGIDCVMKAVEACVSYVRSEHDPFDFNAEIKYIENKVKEFATPEGCARMNEDPGCFTELAELECKSINLLKYIPNNSVQRLRFAGVASRLNAFYRRVQMTPPAGHGNRKPPVTLHLWGNAGSGKTYLLNLIGADAIRTIFELEGVEGDDLMEKCRNFAQYMYYNPVANKFKTNYNSAMSKIFICDDANQVSPHFLKEGNPFPVDLIHYANSHTHLLNVAELENKRNANFNSPLIIATDNDRTPDLDYLACKDAYKRRIDLQFQVRVKPEFIKVFNGVEVVDDSALDAKLVNFQIYEFESKGMIYTYPEMISMVKAALVLKHEKFIHSVQTFKNYAVRDLDPAKTYPIGGRSFHSVLYERARDEEGTILLDDGVVRLKRLYDAPVEESAEEDEYEWEEEEAQAESWFEEDAKDRSIFTKPAPLKEGLWTKAKRVGRIAHFDLSGHSVSTHPLDFLRTRYYMFMFWWTSTTLYRHPFLSCWIFFVLSPYESIRQKILTRNKAKDRERIIGIAKALSVLGVGYGCFKLGKSRGKTTKFFKQTVSQSQPTSPNSHIDDTQPPASESKEEAKSNDEPQQHKYDNGNAKGKTRKPPSTSPTTPIVARPMFPKNQSTDKEVYEASAFHNAPEKQLTSGKAYIMAKLLVSNMYLVQFCIKTTDGIEVRTLRGFFVKGKIFITNKHLLDGLTYDQYSKGYFNLYNVFDTHRNLEAHKVGVTLFSHQGEDESNYDSIALDFTACKIRDHVDVLTVFSTNNGMNPAFIKQSQLADVEGSKIMVLTMTINNQFNTAKELELTGKTAWYVEMQHTKILEVNKQPLEAYNPSGTSDYTIGTMTYNMHSVGGYCGSVVLMNNPEYGGVICGIHMAGFAGNDTSYAQIVTYEMIQTLSLEKHCRVKYRPIMNPQTMLDNSFCAIGEIPHVLRSNNKSRIRPSIFHNKIFPTGKKPAHLGLFNGDHVMNMAMKKYLEPSIAVTSAHEAVFLGALCHRFKPTRSIRQLTYKEAISGIVGNEFIRGVNTRSSAGYPFNQQLRGKIGKTEFVGSDGEWIYDHPVLLHHVNDYMTKAELNERPDCFFVTTAKDELRPCAKVDLGKTRAFAAAPLHFVILCRIFFLDLVANIMEERITNSSLIGINPYSDEWDYLVQKLTNIANPNEELFIATDFTNWDGSLSSLFLWIIYKYIELTYGRNNRITEALWRDITSCWQVFGNIIFQIMRGQPSGNPLTAILNTLYNYALTFLCIWKILEIVGTPEALKLQEDLEKHFYVAIYGDDSIIAFTRELKAVIDITLWSEVMEEMGHHCTPETKDGEISYKKLSEITIIKRGFVYDKDLKHWMAPLDLASIMEPLNWDKCLPEDKEIQMQTNARTAIRELSMHTPEIFNQYRDQIITLCQKFALIISPECYYDQKTIRQIVRRSDNLFYFVKKDCFTGVHKFNYEESSLVAKDTLIVEKLSWNRKVSFPDKTHKQQYGSYIHNGDRHDGSPIKESHQNHMFKFYPTKHVSIRVAQSSQSQTTKTYDDSASNLPFHDDRNEIETGQQIVTFATSEVPIVETLPMETELHDAELTVISEGRSHSIDDVLKREYIILQTTIPIGGEAADQLYLINPIEKFLSQPNVLDKVNGFAFIRTLLNVRFEFTVAPKTSGGLIIAFYADMEDEAIDNRKKKLVQVSQTPNMQLSLTTSRSVIMKIPWVSNFLARNLQSGNGKPGKLYIGRLTPTYIGTVKMTVYIQADEKTLKIEYPTPKTPLMSREEVSKKIRSLQNELRIVAALEDRKKKEEELERRRKMTEAAKAKADANLPSKHMFKEVRKMNEQGIVSGALSTGAKIATAASGLPLLGNASGSAAPILKAAANCASALGFSKPVNDTPLQAIRWKPGDGQLSSQTVLNSHIYSIDQENVIATNYPLFGSELDEMSVDYIMKVPNIVDKYNFQIKTSNTPRQILCKIPLTINPVVYDTDSYLTHQAWVSQVCQNWNADLHYNFDVFLTMFHNAKLRFIVAPNVFDYDVGDELDVDVVNKCKSEVVQFTGDKANISIKVSPMSNTAMKFVATPFEADGGLISNSVLETYQSTEFCSYGTLYVVVEVPLEAVADVSPIVDCVVSFHCTNVELSNPSTGLTFLPTKHSQFSQIGKVVKHSDVTLATGFENNSRSSNIVRSAPLATDLTAPMNTQRNTEISMGDRFNHLNKLLLAFTIFGPTHSLTNTSCLAINPYQFRATVDSEYIDLIDYFACGFGFYTGHMAMRMLIYEKQGYIGESFIMSTFANQYKKANSATGYVIHANAGYLETGVRSVPHFAQEGVVDAGVPYYQPFNIARVSHGNTYGSWNEGQLPVHWFFKSSVEQKVKMYRAIQDQFRFGFLTSLPPFKFQTGPLVRAP